MKDFTILKAINFALEQELANDSRVILLGEDIGKNGGVFRATEGLLTKFGEQRVVDTPIAESLIAGLTVGMSTYGLKPVAEFQFMGFIYPAIEQIFCHAARMRYRTNGQTTCPLVIRAPYTGGIKAPEHHSESTEAIFAHIPGLRVVTPSSPQMAYSLLRSAIQSPDPVIFLEPKRIYNTNNSKVDINLTDIALDKCQYISNGNDITIITWGAMTQTVTEITKEITNNYDLTIDLIDLVSIKPIDAVSIVNSVNRTGKCLIIQEAAKSCSLSSEIATILYEKCWHSLLAPITRVTGHDTIMPAAKLEDYYIPCKKRIYIAIKNLLEH